VNLASIPSPSTAVWHLGPLPLRAYALCIIAGIVVASIITERRMRDRGAPPYAILDVAVWAVPFGIIGARLYNVITSWQVYFGKDGSGALATLKVWEGGLGIWGAVAGGALGAYIACRQLKIPLTFVADCLAPGLPVAQALGRFGNWFNNELYGRQTSLPWGLKVHQMDPSDQGHALVGPDGNPLLLPGTYHPTFLYEVIWDLGTALLVYLLDRKFKFGRGRAFALYVMAYTVGRAWIEYLRIDTANHILGLRLNDWTSIIVFLAALVYFLRVKGGRQLLVPAGEDGFRVVSADEADTLRTGDETARDGETTAAGTTDDDGLDATAPDDGAPDDDRSDGDPADGDRPDGDAPRAAAGAETPRADADTGEADTGTESAVDPDEVAEAGERTGGSRAATK
jgi:prolipoprotein diacylglyceryl transferase